MKDKFFKDDEQVKAALSELAQRKLEIC